MAKKVPRTRAGGTWTEARYFGFIRSALRAAFRRYPVKHQVKKLSGVDTEEGMRYRCDTCSALFRSADVEVDHVKPCGSLKTYDDLPRFVERMFCEADNFQVLCKECHQLKTNEERRSKKWQE